jgi:hypothetical protein
VRKSLVAVLAIVVLAGAAVAAVPLVERHAAEQIKADIEQDGATTLGSAEVSLFDRRIVLNDLRAKRPSEITIGRWEASGLSWPLGELVRGRTPFAGLQLGDPVHAGHLELRDLKMTTESGRWSIASLVIDDFHLDRYDPPTRPDQFGHLIARIGAHLTMSRLEQKDLGFTDAASGDQVRIPSLSVGRYDKGLVGSLAIAGFEFTPKPPRDPVFRMADGKLTDLDLRRMLRTTGAPTWRPGLPIGRIDLGSANLSGFGGEGFTRYGLSLGSIAQQSEVDAGGIRHSRLRIEGFVLDPPARNREALQLRIVLQAMGLKALKLDSECSGTEDRAKGEVAMDRCSVVGPDLGEVTLSMKLVQADAPFWKAVDESNTFALLGSKAGLGEAKLAVVDRGLVERSLKAVATTSGQSLAQVRSDFAQEVRRFQPAGILITEDLTKLLDTVARFIERGGTLTVEAKPETPIGLDKAEYFSRPGPDLMNVLGLSATLSR